MKTLILVRLLKSSWQYPVLPDRERPLGKRGLRDAPIMAARLASRIAIAGLIQSAARLCVLVL